MHDLHEANKILKLVLAKAKENNLKQVTKIVIELGEILEHGQEIQVENLKFNLDLLTKDTLAEDADIVIGKSNNNRWELVEIKGN